MENSTSSSSSGTSQHQALLRTVMELKTDLEMAMNKMLIMDEQNGSLTRNYSQLKEELIDTRRKYNECRENYLSTVADKLADEEKREEFNEKLKIQLSEKTKEFEALRDKFAPQDIDYIRIKVQEELEIPHRQRLHAMEEEVARHKENYFVMKRELESAKAAYEAYSNNQSRDVAAIREEHESVATILREQIARLQESDAVSEKDDIIRAKNNKLHELTLALELSQKDARSLQEERDRYSTLLTEYKATTLEEMEKLKNRVVMATAAKDGAEKRLSHMLQEIDKKEAAVRVFEQSAEDSQRSAEIARRALASVEGQLLALRTEHSKELEDITISNSSERAHLLELADRTQDKLRDREEALRKAMRDISGIQSRAEASESSLRRAHAASSSALKKRLGGLEIELADCTARYHSLQADHSRAFEETEATISAQKADSARLKREKEILHDKVRELEHQVDTERRKNTGLRRDLVARKESAEADMSEEKARLNAAEEELSPLRTKLIEVTAKCSMLEGKYREASAANAALQEDAKSKLTTLQAAYKDRLDSLKSKLKVNVIKERKRGDAYKEKALEAHSRNKAQ